MAFGDSIKKSKSVRGEDEDEQVRRAREVMLRGPQPEGPSRLSRDKSEADVFKVPSLPARASVHSNTQASSSDVFGPSNVGKNKGKAKDVSGDNGSAELEKANKTVCKSRHI